MTRRLGALQASCRRCHHDVATIVPSYSVPSITLDLSANSSVKLSVTCFVLFFFTQIFIQGFIFI